MSFPLAKTKSLIVSPTGYILKGLTIQGVTLILYCVGLYCVAFMSYYIIFNITSYSIIYDIISHTIHRSYLFHTLCIILFSFMLLKLFCLRPLGKQCIIIINIITYGTLNWLNESFRVATLIFLCLVVELRSIRL